MAAPVVGKKFVEVEPRILENVTSSEPVGRSGHCCVTDDAKLYVFGGYNPREGPPLSGQGPATYFAPCRQVMQELWAFNFATRIWRKCPSDGIPQAAASSCMKIRGTKIIVYGGTVFPFGHLMSNIPYICDLTNDKFTWNKIEARGSSDQLPPQAYGQSIILHEDYIYTFAGAVSFYLQPVADLHRLHLGTQKWEKLKTTGNVPRGRYKQEIVVDTDQKRFFVLGGGHLSGAEVLDKLYSYDFGEKNWTLIQTRPDTHNGYPKARSSFGCCQRGDRVIICGGRHYNSFDVDFHNIALADMWALTLSTMMWTKLATTLPKPTFFHSVSLTSSGVLYTYGGIIDGEVRSSKIHKLQLFMPKLMDLCWDMVVDCIPDLHRVPQSVLMEMGIPATFVQRVK